MTEQQIAILETIRSWVLDWCDDSEGVLSDYAEERDKEPLQVAIELVASIVSEELELARLLALADYLDCSPGELSAVSWDDKLFEFGSQEYAVLTEGEALERAADYIRESVWAFNDSWLQSYGVFRKLDSETIQSMAQQCESINDAFWDMLGDDQERFVSDSIAADGIAHFLNTYYDEEIDSCFPELAIFRMG